MATAPVSRIVFEDQHQFIRLEVTTRANQLNHSHPAALSENTLAKILGSFTVNPRPASSLENSFAYMAVPRLPESSPAFPPAVIAFLSKYLNQALQRATTLEEALFFIEDPQPQDTTLLTSGGCYIQNGKFHFQLANYRHPTIGKTEIIKARANPLKVLSRPGYDLIPGLNGKVQPTPVWESLITALPQHVIIEYENTPQEPRIKNPLDDSLVGHDHPVPKNFGRRISNDTHKTLEFLLMSLRNLSLMRELRTGTEIFPLLYQYWKHWASIPFFYALTMASIIGIGSLCWVPQVFPEELSESDIETLEVIEVTGTAVATAPRELSFPLPTFGYPWPTTTFHHLALPEFHVVNLPQKASPRILIDQTGETRGRFTNVKPLKTERPLYPRMAREQGWQGKVLLRVRISADGTVKNAMVQESSGFPILDESAMQAVKTWSFEPAKNGEFPVPSTVDLPIRFDLLR
ncbi:MAG: energy transducer TonB [Nitrospirales bacterium]